MRLLLLVVLAAAWTWYFITWYRSRSEHRNVNSISSFNQHLSVLERTTPGRTSRTAAPSPALGLTTPGLAPPARHSIARPSGRGYPRSRHELRQRRQNILTGLGVTAVATLLVAGLVGGPALWVHLGVDVVLAAYVVALVRIRQRSVERREKVRYLAPQPARVVATARPAEPYLLQQPAN